MFIGSVTFWIFPVSAEPIATPLWSDTTGMDIRSVAVSADGQYVAAGSYSTSGSAGYYGKVSLYSKDGNVLWNNITGNNGILKVAISADGQYIAAGADTGMIFYFSKDGNLLWSYNTGHPVTSLAISEDGGNVASTWTAEWQGKVYYFSQNGTLLWDHWTDTNTRCISVSVSNDGGNVAVGSGSDSGDSGGKSGLLTTVMEH